MDRNLALISLAASLTGVSVGLLNLAQRLGGYESKPLAKLIAGFSCIPVLVVILLAGGWLGLVSVIALVVAGFSIRPVRAWWQKRADRTSSAAVQPLPPYHSRPVAETMAALLIWLVFTVFMGIAPLVAIIFSRQVTGFSEGLFDALPPELVFMSACVIAADGAGRAMRGMFAMRLGLKVPRVTFLGLTSVLTCILCIFVSSQYIVAMIRFSGSTATGVLATTLSDALTWFACAVCGAGSAVIAFETRGFAFRPPPPSFADGAASSGTTS